MEERLVEIRTASATMEAFVTHPREGGPFAPVVLYMDVWGLREELFDVARRIGTVGYYCVVPDLYYRQGKVRHEFRDENNHMISMERLDDARKELVRKPMRALTDEMVVEDTRSLLEFMDAREPVRGGAVGALGYCMGGRHVLRVAGAFPDRFRACASLHGTRLVTDGDDSPHFSAMKAQGELYCGFAEHDPYAPMSTVKTLAETLRHAGLSYRYEVHNGTEHGYTLPDRDIYDKSAANRDWELIFAMFHRQIPVRVQ
jgi:carboxymethylenebutenolidase